MTCIILPFTQSNANNSPIIEHDTMESRADVKRQVKAGVGGGFRMVLRSTKKKKNLAQRVSSAAKDHKAPPKKDIVQSAWAQKFITKATTALRDYPLMKTRLEETKKAEDTARVEYEHYTAVLNKIRRFQVVVQSSNGGESLPKAADFAVAESTPIWMDDIAKEGTRYIMKTLWRYTMMRRLLETRKQDAREMWLKSDQSRISLVKALQSIPTPMSTEELASLFSEHDPKILPELREFVGVNPFDPIPRFYEEVDEKTPPPFPCTDKQLMWFAANDPSVLQELCGIYTVHMKNKIDSFRDKENLSLKDERGFSLIHLAVLRGNPDCVKTLILMAPRTINCMGPGIIRVSPLMLALEDKNLEIVRILLEFGGPFNTDICYGGWNVMHHAAASGDAKCADLIVNAAKKRLSEHTWNDLCSTLTDGGDNPMDLAEKFGFLDTIPPALSRFELQTIFRYEAPYMGVSQDRLQRIIHRSDLNWVDPYYGYPPLFLAVRQKHKLAVVQLLIARGCDPDQKHGACGTLLEFVKDELIRLENEKLRVISDLEEEIEEIRVTELEETRRLQDIEIEKLREIECYLTRRKAPKRTRGGNHLVGGTEHPRKRSRK